MPNHKPCCVEVLSAGGVVIMAVDGMAVYGLLSQPISFADNDQVDGCWAHSDADRGRGIRWEMSVCKYYYIHTDCGKRIRASCNLHSTIYVIFIAKIVEME